MKNWEKGQSREVCRGKIFKYNTCEFSSPETKKSAEFDILIFADWVNIIAITENYKVVMAKQFRVGDQRITLEIPGGAVDPGEDFLEAAKRELEEETGYVSENWQKIGEVSPNPAFQTNTCQTYLALDAKPEGVICPDEMEEIEVKLYDYKELREMAKSGFINHSLVISAFYFYDSWLVADS